MNLSHCLLPHILSRHLNALATTFSPTDAPSRRPDTRPTTTASPRPPPALPLPPRRPPTSANPEGDGTGVDGADSLLLLLLPRLPMAAPSTELAPPGVGRRRPLTRGEEGKEEGENEERELVPDNGCDRLLAPRVMKPLSVVRGLLLLLSDVEKDAY